MRANAEDVKSLVSMRDIMGMYNLHPQRGKKYICPFHTEKTPSLMVYDNTNVFTCFGCSAKGDIYKFVMLMNNCDFESALSFICDKFGIENDNGLTPEERKAYGKAITDSIKQAQERKERIEQTRYTYSRLCDYRRFLAGNVDIRDFDNELYCEALRNLVYIDYILDEYLSDRDGQLAIDMPDVNGWIKSLRAMKI